MELMKSLNPHQLTCLSLKPTLPFPHTLKTHQKNTLISLSSNSTSFSLLLRRPTVVPPRRPPGKPTTTASSPSDILRLMDGLDLPIPIEIYTSLIKECTEKKDPAGARELFRHVIVKRVFPSLVFVNRVLLMLVVCGLIEDARQMFDKMIVRDSNTWAILIGGYIVTYEYEEAINLFLRMDFREKLENGDDVKLPFSWIVVCVLKACVETKRLRLGKQVHGLVMKFGYDGNLFLSSSLMNFYGNFGCSEGLDCVFNHLGNRNTAIWTNKLVNHCREEQFKEAIDIFREMGREGVKKNEFTFSSVLRACGRLEDDGLCGRQVHGNLIKLGLDSNDFVQCGLVDMYAKCGLIEYANRVFRTIEGERTLACWNAMLTGYTQHGYCVDAFKVIYAMKSVGLHPQESLINEVKFSCGSRVIESETRPCISELSLISEPFRKESIRI